MYELNKYRSEAGDRLIDAELTGRESSDKTEFCRIVH